MTTSPKHCPNNPFLNRRQHRLMLAVAAALSGAPGPNWAQDVNLANFDNGFRIDGARVRSVSGAGDVNGDGLADVISGNPLANGTGDFTIYLPGVSYVIFGKSDEDDVDANNLSGDGFTIIGSTRYGSSGFSVSGAGDVNGDGLADLIVGEPGNGASTGFDGAGYVVFGKPDSAPVELDNLGTGGFRINGEPDDSAGRSVSGAGDVNGDGLSDLIVGAPYALPNGVDEMGTAYVVFGKADSLSIDLDNLGNNGFALEGASQFDLAGGSVSGAGDVNGDGLADLIVGATGADPGGALRAGSSYVVFGKIDATAVNLGSLGNNGFRIDGANSFDRSGSSVSGAGDVNGDGLADLIIGASDADPSDALEDAGASYVVFGKADIGIVDLADLGSAGFRLDGAVAGDESGVSVAGVGDINGDGLADLMIGAYRAEPAGSRSGSGFVILGKVDNDPVDLGNLGNQGFRIDGFDVNQSIGFTVSGAGDVNGDGAADVLIGGSCTNFNYALFSQQALASSAAYRGYARAGDAPRLAIGTTGDGSNADHPDSRVWIDFVDGNEMVDQASPINATLTRSSGAFSEAAAEVSWELDTDRANWSTAEVSFRIVDSELTSDAVPPRLQLVFSPDGQAPFTPLPDSVLNLQNNTISANVSQLGFFYIGQRPDEMFSDGFE